MKVSCSTLTFTLTQYPDLKDNLNAIKALGFKAIDLAAFNNWQNISPVQLASNPAYGDSMVEAVLNSGLIVGSLNCGFSQEISVESESAYQTFLSEFTAMIAFAKRINCPNITSQPGTLNNAKNIRQSLDRIISRAPQLNALVKESGISYSLEGHHGSILESIENCDYLMQKAFPLIGLTYDPSHFAMQGIPLADTTSLLDYAMHVHIRNAKNGVMQANMTDGEIQIDTFAKMLQEKNWNGYIAIEYFRGFDIDCQNTLAIAKQLIAQGSTN